MQGKTYVAMAVVVVFGGITLGGCETKKEDLTYEGSSTISEKILPSATAAFTAKTGIKFASISHGGSGAGFKAVMAGTVPLGGLSRELKDSEKAQRPFHRIIGYDAMGVFVHSSNPVTDLTKEQIRDIYSGKITNWKDVGGEDAAISVITEIQAGGRATTKVFKKAILGDLPFGPATEIDKPADCILAVGKDPNAIASAAMPFQAPNTKALKIDGVEPDELNTQMGTYLITRPLILITKGKPEGSMKVFLDYMMSAEGQKHVREAGFVPVR